MKSLKTMAAVAAVMSWAAFNGEEASAQVYYGYPTATPQYQAYAPTSLRCGYGNGTYGNGVYRNNRTYPVGVLSSPYQSNGVRPAQHGSQVRTYPQPGYGVPVFYRPAVMQPSATQYGVPVNRSVYPSAGHFSVEDRFLTSPTITQPVQNPATLPASLTNSPFYQTPGTIVPTSGYTPTRSYSPLPAISAPITNSPFYR
jgi:hypothetical protein